MTYFDDLGLSGQALQAVRPSWVTAPHPCAGTGPSPKVLEGQRPNPLQRSAARAKLGCIQFAHHGQARTLRATKARSCWRSPPTLFVEQIGEVCGTIAKNTHHRILTGRRRFLYNPQIQALSTAASTCSSPRRGRLVDLYDQGAAHLSSVEVLVLDEADRAARRALGRHAQDHRGAAAKPNPITKRRSIKNYHGTRAGGALCTTGRDRPPRATADTVEQ